MPISTVACANGPAVDDAGAIDDADDEARDVVFAVGVEAGHLRGFAAEERAAVVAACRREALDDLHGHVGLEPAGGEVVEKEQRPGALDQDVVDAVVDEIPPDGVVDAGHEGDAELRADAVGARHQHRLANAGRREREEAAEGADVGENAGGERPLGQRADALDDFVAGVDVDARVLVIHPILEEQAKKARSEDRADSLWRRVFRPGAAF